ncbi:MAG: FKBP-type peptidyl-prolyl cis-trans isomerase [Minisyncoccia bacterium]
MNITGTGVAVALAVSVALAFLFFGPAIFTSFNAASNSAATAEATTDMTLPANDGAIDSVPTQDSDTLRINDAKVGMGATAEAGDTVTVNYVGALTDGTVFDASQNHGQPFTFTLGSGEVISGWDQGLVGMKEGGQRLLVIPANMAYGDKAVGPIPANSTLVFQVELVKVEKGK